MLRPDLQSGSEVAATAAPVLGARNLVTQSVVRTSPIGVRLTISASGPAGRLTALGGGASASSTGRTAANGLRKTEVLSKKSRGKVTVVAALNGEATTSKRVGAGP